MEARTEYIEKMCSRCGRTIRIRKVSYPGGTDNSGYFEVECLDCKEVFEIYVGTDVDASEIVSGAKLLKRRYK
ncbi:MAG: hypothetical protein PHW36_02475 [Bacilli bacterium]|jgi:phage FluMu protein Com|nr:hypothetical protein [Bacilli bacterium]